MISDQQFTQQTMDLTPTLYRLSMSILRHEADCRDAVQQALMKAWAARDRVDPDRFRAYLTRIVVNECRNIQRRRQRVYPVAEMPDTEAVYQPEKSELAEAIQLLPESLRTPLLLFYMENYTEKETARALGITVTAVKNRLFRARRALKQRLTDWEVAPK
ncbi:MAG: RNA polymerase sigma factor [Christensenellales bacterium]|jgi:RNA polymerase sigma-70 factor (ECF subfamily)